MILPTIIISTWIFIFRFYVQINYSVEWVVKLSAIMVNYTARYKNVYTSKKPCCVNSIIGLLRCWFSHAETKHRNIHTQEKRYTWYGFESETEWYYCFVEQRGLSDSSLLLSLLQWFFHCKAVGAAVCMYLHVTVLLCGW